MDLQLTEKNVLVTGAGQGLGRAIGMAFAGEGANVAFHYHSSGEGAAEGAAAAQTQGVSAISVQADLRDPDAVPAAVDEVETTLGPIDILINNAAATQSKPFFETTEEEWMPQIDVNVTGVLRITRAVTERMAQRKSGTVVSLMGDSGRVGESRLLVTATTRASTLGLTKSIAKEMARHGIRANAVSIGLVQTENFDEHTGHAEDERMQRILAAYPLRRLGRPEDVTPTILLLASPMSGWTTGQTLSVNGGYSMP